MVGCPPMLRRLGLVALTLVAACTGPSFERRERDHHEDGRELVGTARSALEGEDPLSVALVDGGCTTSVLNGLSTQLVEEIQCMRPGTLASIEGAPGFSLGKAVFPWLQVPAQQALLAAQAARGVTMTINSA